MADTPSPEQTYRIKRRRQWDIISLEMINRGRRTGRFYHDLLERYYQFLVPPGLTVLELGCGQGDLLSALKPLQGVGIDFSANMIAQAKAKHPHLDFICADAHHIELTSKFDIIILSDLVNDLWDVQSVLKRVASFSHDGTRLIINFFNNMWRIPVDMAKKNHLAVDLLEQNWLTPQDISNLLHLTGYEQINSETKILLPTKCPVIEPLFNRCLIHFPPFHWFGLTNFMVARLAPVPKNGQKRPSPLVSVIIPVKNEAGNIKHIMQKPIIPGYRTELIFVEGGSTDGTREVIEHAIGKFPDNNCRLITQPGHGKGDAVRAGFDDAVGDILIILDADLTVAPEALPRFIEALVSGKGEFINGVRLVYPMENQSMPFLNMVINKIFSLLFSWLLGQSIKDTLCGTKALWKADYETIQKNEDGSSGLDPFGDFNLLFNATKINLKIVDLPVRYRRRRYGTTNIKRWQHGWLLLKMAAQAARRIKFK